MSMALENMTKEELQALVLEQQKKFQTTVQENNQLEKQIQAAQKKIQAVQKKIQVKEQEIQVIAKEKEALLKKIQDMLEKFSSMKFELSQLKRLIFGSKRERFVSGAEDAQMSLPFDIETESQEETSEAATEEVSSHQRRKRKNHPGRLSLPDHLPVEEIIIEPEEDVTGLKCIGHEVTDELEYQQAILKINRFMRPKYAREDNEGVICGNLPSRPIEKGIAGPGLLSHILVSKYVYHLPFYRQSQRFKIEHQIDIPRSTMGGWQGSIANLLRLLYEEQKRQVLGQGYLEVDETPIQVLDPKKKGKTHRGYYWVYYSPIQRMVLFDYQEGRGREGPRKLLSDFKGYLQTDGYIVYDWFGKQKDITLLSCMAHARRMFEKSLGDDKKRAEFAMTEIQKLYQIERRARQLGLSAEQRHELRLNESLPILNELGKWMAAQVRTTLPKSPFGKALIYSVSRWDNLMNYLRDGHLEIDNNLVENAIRPTAIGKKNYLFAGSHAGAKSAAMFYSFFATCKHNNVDPFTWLKKVLEIIPDYPANKLSDLLPQKLNLS
ncbi:MAG: IS66 family transposase [Candidatus Atribacteria bacterium]|nr:MAG: IS66 family transposase [Candidatus Atribacteria bacterium]